MKEVSGAAAIGGDRLLLAGDDPENAVYLLTNASAGLTQNPVPQPAGFLDALQARQILAGDLEDIAWDPVGKAAYLLTGHSRSNSNNDPPKRRLLLRLALGPDQQLASAKPFPVRPAGQDMEIVDLRGAAVAQFPFLGEAVGPGWTPNQGGFNLEGLAWVPPGHLLIGMRAPRMAVLKNPDSAPAGRAIVLRLTNPEALFQDQPQPPKFDPGAAFLNLKGNGIRGMTYDAVRLGVWIIAGHWRDPLPTEPNNWGLWFWDLKGEPREYGRLGSTLVNPEAVTIWGEGNQRRLLLIEDGDNDSPFEFLPIPVP